MRRLAPAASTALALLAPAIAWACSGPGATAAILRAERLGWLLFAASVLVAAAGVTLLRRLGSPWGRAAWLAAPLLVHPGWWMSARGGDCGITRLLGSYVLTAVTLVAAVVGVIVAATSARARSRRPGRSSPGS
ncbi:MAG TPA: hypothetical protein VGQ83_21575 [Polyangia bacterium]|jgi:hypothetical protein